MGKVGGWFGVGAVDEAAKQELFKKNVQELVERFPDCSSDLARRFLTVSFCPPTTRVTRAARSHYPTHARWRAA